MPRVTLRNIDSPAAYTRGHRMAYPGYNTPHVKLADRAERKQLEKANNQAEQLEKAKNQAEKLEKAKNQAEKLAKRTKEIFEEKMKKWREGRAAAKGGRTRRGRKSRSTRRR
jgi:hypothetical protein